MEQSADIEIGSSSSPASGSTSETYNDEFRFLDYLSTDFSYLRRFILASHQMVRLLQTETAQSNEDMQEKLVNNIEIAKETLSEAGASARPFVACPEHLVRHRQSYFEMLSAARSLVPYMKDADVKLRLRRLVLPLTSTSRFRVALPAERPKVNNGTPLPSWWNNPGTNPKVESLGPGPAALLKPSAPRRKMRRSSASAVLKFASSPISYSTCSSNSPSKSPAARSAASPKRLRASPYPSHIPPVSGDTDAPPNEQKGAETAAPSPSTPDTSTSSPPSQQVRPQLRCEQMPSVPPPAYVSPHSPKPLSLLQQQHRDLGAGYAAFQKSTQSGASNTARWDWSTPNRSSLSGIDCNLPHPNGPPGSTPVRTANNLTTISSSNANGCPDEDFDEANESFKKGLGWAPLLKRDWSETGGVPTPSEGLTWCTSWDDETGPHSAHSSELVVNTLATFPSEPTPQKSLAESTCIVM